MKWKGNEVVIFKWKQFHGFIPKRTGIVIEETAAECLVRTKYFWKVWTFKYDKEKIMTAEQIAGYCKLIKK